LPFPADTLWSYEIGAKGDLLGGRLHVEPSVFHIQWNNTQPDPVIESCNFVGSLAATAVSDGFELAVQALLTEHVKLGLALAYTDAHYTQTLKSGNAVILHTGDAIGYPGQAPSPWNVTTWIEYKFALSGGVAVDLRAEHTFHSRNPGPFFTDHPGSPFFYLGDRPDPSTNLLNLRASARWPNFDLALFVNNSLASQPVLNSATTFRPRTVGLSGTWRF